MQQRSTTWYVLSSWPGLSYANNILLQLWTLINFLPVPTSQAAAEQRKLQAEYLAARREMNATSSQDEFAKWAKMRRKHDKLLEQLEASSTCTSHPLGRSETCSITITITIRTEMSSTNHPASACRKGTRLSPLQVRQGPDSLALPPHPRAAIHHPLLVRDGAHVLAAARLVPLLRRVDHLVPASALGKRFHRLLAARMRGHPLAADRRRYDRDWAGTGHEAKGGSRSSCWCGEEQGGSHHESCCGREEDFIDATIATTCNIHKIYMRNSPKPQLMLTPQIPERGSRHQSEGVKTMKFVWKFVWERKYVSR